MISNRELHKASGLIRQGEIETAQAICEQARASGPSDTRALADLWFRLSMLHSQSGNVEKALYSYRRVLELAPRHIGAHSSSGDILYRLGRYDDACNTYKVALDIQPYNAAFCCNIALTLLARGIRTDAVRYCMKAIQVQPAFFGGYLTLAHALMAQGEFEQALRNYRKARQLDPDDIDSKSGEMIALEHLGKTGAAFELLRPLIDKGAVTAGTLSAYATLAPGDHEKRKAAALIEEYLSNTRIMHRQELELRFAAGRLYDDLGDYKKAFLHYSKGNRIAVKNFHEEAIAEQFQAIMDAFDAPGYRSFPRTGNQSRKPIFIVGMPRSGTTLVEHILSSHPLVYGAGELPFIRDLSIAMPELTGTTTHYPACMASITRSGLDKLADRYLLQINDLSQEALRITDKMPHNFMHIGLISLLFPGATIIHVRRNPLDTCLSCYFQYFASGNDYTYDLKTLGIHYRQYRLIMEHWVNALNIAMFELDYEKLVENREEVSRKLIDYCGLPWDDNCLAHQKDDQVARTASYAQVRKPVYSSSRDRWKNYAPYIGPLIDALGDAAR